MNARRTVTAGLRRGWTEFGHFLANPKEIWQTTLGAVGVYAALVLFIGDREVPGTGVPLGLFITAGYIATMMMQVGLYNLPMMITADREEGALLRLRGIPGGIAVYLVGKGLLVLAVTVTVLAMMLVAGVLLAGIALPADPAKWLTLAWVLVLSLLATVPLGAAVGCLLPNVRSGAGILMVPFMVFIVAAGVFFPVTAFPEPMQAATQAIPLYWMALGVRSVFLPDSMLAAELHGSWQPVETAAVLGAWALAGMVLAPLLLRRMTRKESGSRLAARRERASARAVY
ncbi:ABC transporter permease [Allonocardiopsis opalescens]|uniref:ABC-2 type transport system permease protein n=1 Tax=Allonocardiopsis opalescens TaxID=1144618 RepID=A0A2T0Q6F1_9ACTN|nr:ABC transporter permease [Allonocardiopsis opalescens]PRX99406.1 ABC-2 type transport system permease protein [Allonocardiopsis opalescens]